MNNTKDVSYIGKDYNQFKTNLIEFTKQYFPDTYTDFNESSPGTIFLEMAAYVGDVLSFYADDNLKESLLEQASERGNIYDLAKTLGYKANNSVPAYVDLSVFQLVPSTGTGDNVRPNFDYALSIKPGMRVRQNNGDSTFRTLDSIVIKGYDKFPRSYVKYYAGIKKGKTFNRKKLLQQKLLYMKPIRLLIFLHIIF